MKAKVNKRNVYEAASQAAKIMNKLDYMPMSDCLYMKVEDGKITFSAFSKDMTLFRNCDDVVADCNFECVFKADIFLHFLSKVRAEDVTLEYTEEKKARTLFLKGGTMKMKLQCMELDNWPTLTPMTDPSFEAETDFLFPAIMQCKHALGIPNGPAMMDDFYIEQKGENWNITALDGKRVSIRGNYTDSFEPEQKILLNGHCLVTLQSIFEDSVTLAMKDDAIRINDEKTTVYLRTVFGIYFNVNHILNGEFPNYVKVNRSDLLDTISLLRVFKDKDQKYLIHMTIRDGEIYVESSDNQENELDGTIPAETNLENPIHVTFNADYWLDALKSITEEEIHIWFHTPKHPFLLKGDNYTEVILPILSR